LVFNRKHFWLLLNQDVAWSTSYDRSVIGNNYYGLYYNGKWNRDRYGYVGLNTERPDSYMRFDFKVYVA